MRIPRNNNNKIIEAELSYKLVGISFNVQNRLGRFCRENQYADALENELKRERIDYKREYLIILEDKKSNFVDFIIGDKVLIDLKAKPFIEKDDYYQMKRYLESSNIKLGLIINFRQKHLQPKRVLNSKCNLQHSDAFVVSHRGFTLVELLVSMTLFLVLIGIATGGFIRALRSQRAIVELMVVNDNTVLTLEQMAREIRTGYNFSKISESELQFVNADNIVVFYRLSGGVIERGTEDVFVHRTYKKITADNIRVVNFNVALFGNSPGDGFPPRITISISVTGKSKYLENFSTNIQTTISARMLDT